MSGGKLKIVGAGELGQHPSPCNSEKAAGDSREANVGVRGRNLIDEGAHYRHPSSIDNEALEHAYTAPLEPPEAIQQEDGRAE